MLYDVVVAAESLQPSRHLPNRVPEAHEPHKARVVSAYHKLSAQEIMSEVCGENNHSQQFLARCAVGPLFEMQDLAAIGYGAFLSSLSLAERGSNGDVGCIGIQDEDICGIWIS